MMGGQNFRSPGIPQLPGMRTGFPEQPYVSALFETCVVVTIHELLFSEQIENDGVPGIPMPGVPGIPGSGVPPTNIVGTVDISVSLRYYLWFFIKNMYI